MFRVAVQTGQFTMPVVVVGGRAASVDRSSWPCRRGTVVGQVVLFAACAHVRCTRVDSVQQRWLGGIHPWNRATCLRDSNVPTVNRPNHRPLDRFLTPYTLSFCVCSRVTSLYILFEHRTDEWFSCILSAFIAISYYLSSFGLLRGVVCKHIEILNEARVFVPVRANPVTDDVLLWRCLMARGMSLLRQGRRSKEVPNPALKRAFIQQYMIGL